MKALVSTVFFKPRSAISLLIVLWWNYFQQVGICLLCLSWAAKKFVRVTQKVYVLLFGKTWGPDCFWSYQTFSGGILMHNGMKVFSMFLVVFDFNAEFQDKQVSEYWSVMKFHEICMLRNYIFLLNEVIYAWV